MNWVFVPGGWRTRTGVALCEESCSHGLNTHAPLAVRALAARLRQPNPRGSDETRPHTAVQQRASQSAWEHVGVSLFFKVFKIYANQHAEGATTGCAEWCCAAYANTPALPQHSMSRTLGVAATQEQQTQQQLLPTPQSLKNLCNIGETPPTSTTEDQQMRKQTATKANRADWFKRHTSEKHT